MQDPVFDLIQFVQGVSRLHRILRFLQREQELYPVVVSAIRQHGSQTYTGGLLRRRSGSAIMDSYWSNLSWTSQKI